MASAASASTAVADRQVHTLIFVCDPERAPLPSANAEAEAVQQCFAPHGRRAVVQRGGDAATLRELLERHQPRILHFIGHADAKHPLNKELTLGFTAPDGALITILPTVAYSASSRPSTKKQTWYGSRSVRMSSSSVRR